MNLKAMNDCYYMEVYRMIKQGYMWDKASHIKKVRNEKLKELDI